MNKSTDYLKNIHIEAYTQDADELRIFAMLRFYLNVADKPVMRIEEALEDSDIRGIIIAARNTAITETAHFDGNRYPLNKFFSDLDQLEISEKLEGQMRRFLADCRGELKKIEYD